MNLLHCSEGLKSFNSCFKLMLNLCTNISWTLSWLLISSHSSSFLSYRVFEVGGSSISMLNLYYYLSFLGTDTLMPLGHTAGPGTLLQKLWSKMLLEDLAIMKKLQLLPLAYFLLLFNLLNHHFCWKTQINMVLSFFSCTTDFLILSLMSDNRNGSMGFSYKYVLKNSSSIFVTDKNNCSLPVLSGSWTAFYKTVWLSVILELLMLWN